MELIQSQPLTNLTGIPTIELIRRIDAGLPFSAMRDFANTGGLSESTVATTIGIPARTLSRRKNSGKLALAEAERLIRLATLYHKAIELFEEDVDQARAWFLTPKKQLDNHSPLAYCRTELGAREVENLIGRLEHGVFS